MDIVSRAEWGARPPRSRVTGDTVTETYLHHSAGPHSGAAGVRSIQNYHMDHQGWTDIAYNFLIDPDTLTVYEGRGWGVRPGSQKSHNTGTWSICVLGNFQTERPTPALLETIAELIRHGSDLGEIRLELTGGHRDAPGQSTSCPGTNLHSQLPTIRNLLEDDMPTLDEIIKGVWFTKYTDHVTGSPQFAITHVRKAREDANEALINSRTILRAIEQAGSIDLSPADIAAIREGVAEEVAAEFAERLLD